MDINTSLQFIQKTIEKTKNNELIWVASLKDKTLKPIPVSSKNEFDISIVHLPEAGYYTSYKNSDLVLAVFTYASDLLFLSPPNNCTLSLRMQDASSKYAVEIANSDASEEMSIQLIRLYNLIDKDTSSLNALIQDFLNS